MKKIICCLVLIYFVFVSIAFADELDLESMSLEELLDLQIRVQESIAFKDQYNELVYYPGEYEIGKNIEPGTYIVHPLSLEPNKKWLTVAVYDIEWNNGSDSILELGENVQFDFKEGYIFYLDYGTVTLIKRK